MLLMGVFLFLYKIKRGDDYGSRFMFLDDKRVQDYHWFKSYAELPDVVKIKGVNYKKTKEEKAKLKLIVEGKIAFYH